MADDTPEGSEKPPAPLAKVSSPAPAPIQVIPSSPAAPEPLAPVDPILVNNIAWYFWLLRWAVRVAAALFLPVVGLVVWIIWNYVELKTKVDNIDGRIKSEVLASTNEVRKELTAESKRQADELELLKKTIQNEAVINDLVCHGQYESALAIYKDFLNEVKPKEIPDSLKLPLYRSIITAVANGKRYDFLKDDELAKMEAVLRKDTSLCGAITLYNMAIIYAAQGNLPHARLLTIATIDIATDPLAMRVQGTSGEYFALLLMIAIAQEKAGTPKDQANVAWETLKLLEEKDRVTTDVILHYFEQEKLTSMKDVFTLRLGNKHYQAAHAELINLLETHSFAWVEEEVTTSNGEKAIVRKWKSIKREKPKNKVTVPPEPPGKCCSG